ncbi:hypothetical protein GXM_01780 [Nostoc sphaeroides CCNUC1]|uniref:Uncharacterized protein n=1 Tax=Nostoc sphaeroides CCNUC1 TaxID=2653204 RepID=A0A5P8VVD0_9NOSO|nr:hypothetical protein GXM_01780 [Nostoc sphaeroides CCNUC1]
MDKGQITNDKSGRYTQQFVQHEHFYFLQFDTNIFSLQSDLKEGKFA